MAFDQTPIQNINIQAIVNSRLPSAEMDSAKALPINDDEEKERLTGLQQRENLIRGLGIVDYVCRLLNSLPQSLGGLQHQQAQVS